jgi:hypothetical protein
MWGGPSAQSAGHVAVVTSVAISGGNGKITLLEENGSASGVSSITVNNGNMSYGSPTYKGGEFYYTSFQWLTGLPASGGGSPTGLVPVSGVMPTGAWDFVYYVASDGTLRVEHWTGTKWQLDNFGQQVKAGTSPSAYLS